MTELLNKKQPELLWGNRLLSNFHMKVPRFSLISSSKGRISNSLNKGAACSLPFFDRIILTAFLLETLKAVQVSGIGGTPVKEIVIQVREDKGIVEGS